jgi:uncharacterized membrane protein YkgB
MKNFDQNASAARRILGVLANIEQAVIDQVQKHDPLLARVAMAIVYFWFGILKLVGLSPANPMVQSLQAKTLPFLSFDQFIILFALFEMLIGILFLVPKATRVVMVLFLGHMVTTTMPLVLLPQMTWQKAFVPTMEGQYIIKNVVLIALAASVAMSFRRRALAKTAALRVFARVAFQPSQEPVFQPRLEPTMAFSGRQIDHFFSLSARTDRETARIERI